MPINSVVIPVTFSSFFKVAVVLIVPERAYKFNCVEPHFQTSAARSRPREATKKTVTALPRCSEGHRKPTRGAGEIGTDTPARVVVRDIVRYEEIFRGRGDSNRRFERRFGKTKFSLCFVRNAAQVHSREKQEYR